MTTPAINRSVVKSRPFLIQVRNSVSPTWATTGGGNVNYEWDNETRPVSHTVPFAIDGWRQCSAWSHSGRLQSRSLGDVIRRRDRISDGVWDEHKRDSGAFWPYQPAAIPAVPSGLVSEAEIKALNRLKDSKINLGVFLAEAKKTGLMIGNAAYRIGYEVQDFRLRYPKGWEEVKRWQIWRLKRLKWHCIPSKWLELQYGWIPLMNDIFGAVQHLGDRNRFAGTLNNGLINCKAKSERKETRERVLNAVIGQENKATIEQEIVHRARVKLWYQLNSGTLAELASLGLTNPAEIIWEIVPYSHVVDWVVPIGNWLSALDGDRGFSFKGGSCSVRSSSSERVTSTEWERDYPDGAFKVNTSGQPLSLQGEAYRFTRSCYSQSPVPGVYFKNPLSWKHMLNGLAMLAQAFR